MQDTDVAAAQRLIAKWKGVAATELSTSQSFLIELCELLGVERPHATPEQDYMFERPLTFHHADGSRSAGRVDLYRRGAFVLESKKLEARAHTRGFDEAMLRAHSQAQAYARALPPEQGRPPFLVVVDVGHRIELYSEHQLGYRTPASSGSEHWQYDGELLDERCRRMEAEQFDAVAEE